MAEKPPDIPGFHPVDVDLDDDNNANNGQLIDLTEDDTPRRSSSISSLEMNTGDLPINPILEELQSMAASSDNQACKWSSFSSI